MCVWMGILVCMDGYSCVYVCVCVCVCVAGCVRLGIYMCVWLGVWLADCLCVGAIYGAGQQCVVGAARGTAELSLLLQLPPLLQGR